MTILMALGFFALLALASDSISHDELVARTKSTLLVSFYDQSLGEEELNLVGFNSGITNVRHLHNVGLSIVETENEVDAFLVADTLSALDNVEYVENDSLVSIADADADWWKEEEVDFDLLEEEGVDFDLLDEEDVDSDSYSDFEGDYFDFEADNYAANAQCSNLQPGMRKIGVDKVNYLGNKNVRVCVIDTGSDYKHTYLQNTVWVNQAEKNGRGGVDDDKNGYKDDVYGLRSDGSGSADPIDAHGHGTHCTGVIAGDCKGKARGVAPAVTTIPCGFLTARGSGTLAGAVACIDYSLAVKCQISSNSWGGGSVTNALNQAINRARAAGQLFVAAAGNDRRNKDAGSPVLAGLTQDNVMIVAASVSSNDAPASFTAYGAKSVDVAAPGVGVISHVPGNGFRSMSGTSMACPHVAGLAALLLSKAMDNRKCPTPAQLIDIICKSGDRLPSSWASRPTRCGTRINVPKSMAALAKKMRSFKTCSGAPPPPPPPPPPTCKNVYTYRTCRNIVRRAGGRAACTKFPAFMGDHCRKYCGLCK